MPSWTDCFNSIVIGRVDRRWQRSARSWDEDLDLAAITTIRGARTFGQALVYSYTFLNHHVGAARQAFELCPDESITRDECVLVDYGCGPGSALMGLAEAHFAITQSPLRVHYLGIEMAGSTSIAIAREMFDCIKAAGLITQDSTCEFSEFGRQHPWHAAPNDAQIFFALSYVMAHPYFNLPADVPGRPPPPDPVLDVRDEILTCREHYERSVHVVYANGVHYEGRSIHAAWDRLTQYLHVGRNVRHRQYPFDYFLSRNINGRGNIENWRRRQFRFPARVEQGKTDCDYQILM